MRVSEGLAVAYFVYLAVCALWIPIGAGRRVTLFSVAALVVGAEALVASVPSTPLLEELRDWLPALVILAAYFATGLFFVEPSPAAEAWLRRWDRRLIGWRPFERLPRLFRLYLHLVYDGCFLVVPAGFAVLIWNGDRSLADRYWTLVSAAEFFSFGTLPWFQARPPWLVESRRPDDRAGIRRFSLAWVHYTTIRANTFPSGHASASFAVALALWRSDPQAGALFAVLALSIAVGSVVGRFHYAIDAVTGLLLALVLWGAAAVARF